MAIDSAKKRKSIAAIGLIVVGPVVVPDSTIDAADRQVVAYSYSGIAAGEPAGVTAESVCIYDAWLNIAEAETVLEIAQAETTLGC